MCLKFSGSQVSTLDAIYKSARVHVFDFDKIANVPRIDSFKNLSQIIEREVRILSTSIPFMARYIWNELRPDAFNFTLSIKFHWTCGRVLLTDWRNVCCILNEIGDLNGIGRMRLRTRTYYRIIEFVRISVWCRSKRRAYTRSLPHMPTTTKANSNM